MWLSLLALLSVLSLIYYLVAYKARKDLLEFERSVSSSAQKILDGQPSLKVTSGGAFRPTEVRGKHFRNRIIKAATFEAGCDLQGIPLESLVKFHEDVAKGGAGMSIVAYGAVTPGGRSFPSQLICREQSSEGMKRLTAAIHKHGALAAIQLTHAGVFSDRKLSESDKHEQMSAKAIFNPAGFNFCRKMSQAEEDYIVEKFAEAAQVAIESGFDCVEIHCGHGYLLSQYISPRTNSGKSLGARLQLPIRVIQAVRSSIGDRAVLMVKMNLVDGMQGGLEVAESCRVAAELAAAGVDIMALSGGMILENGLYMLRGNVPLMQMITAQTTLVKQLALLIFGKILVPELKFQEMFFRLPALCVQRSLMGSDQNNRRTTKTHVCLIGGVHSTRSLRQALETDGFDFVQCGRALLKNPGIANEWKASLETNTTNVVSNCSKCNQCIVNATMRQTPITCVEW